MSEGFDTASQLSASEIDAFYADGMRFVMRYLAPQGSWKRLTREEAQRYTDRNIYIVSAFERGATRTSEGASAGSEDGKLALQLAKEVGQPEGSMIAPAVDYDAPESDYDAIEAYMRAFDAEIVGYELGAYGSYDVCKMLYERGVTKKIIQTYAWSRGKWLDYACIQQYDNGASGQGKIINGVNVDLCRSNGDAGGWKVGMAITHVESAPQLSQAVADSIINSFLSVSYANCEAERAKAEAEGRTADAEAWQKLRDWQHTLANALRRASGEPEQ